MTSAPLLPYPADSAAVTCERPSVVTPLDDPARRARLAFAGAIAAGLSATPRTLDSRWLYDAAGSALFERITTVPEYYLTRVEDTLLARHAAALRRLIGPQTLIELGCGNAEKTRHLLRAWCAAGSTHYLGVDVSAAALDTAVDGLRRACPSAQVSTLLGAWDHCWSAIADVGPACVLLLGSSLGNLDESATDALFANLAEALAPGSHFLLGVDLAKDAARLQHAYDDAAGVTASFTRNLFARMNRELGTRLPLAAIEHVARWNERAGQIEIDARFTRAADIHLPELARSFHIAAGETIRTEISRKFEIDALAGVAASHELRLRERFVDPQWGYALLLFQRAAANGSDPRRADVERMLRCTRARTHALVAALDDEQLKRSPSALLGPIAWDLGHIANFAERWVAAANRRRRAESPADRFFDPIQQPRAARARLALPNRDRLLTALAHSDTAMRRLLHHGALNPSDPLLARGYLFAMLAQHEAQHAETMLQSVQRLECAYEPLDRDSPPIAQRRVQHDALRVPGGTFLMGTDDTAVAYDNERPAHRIDLPAYRIDPHPISNAQYLAFVRDDGYDRPALWTPAGWAWRQTLTHAHPAQWMQTPEGDWDEIAFGRRLPLAPDRPVMHVSWYEADAYARWAGRRLPTEAEWEKAAAWDPERDTGRVFPWGDTPPSPALAQLGGYNCGPAALGAHPAGRSWIGCEQMIGSVWEWTASDFAPYPGFVAFPYPEYSAVHFGRGYKVLRGGSWATQPIAIRNTFRNWDLPDRRHLFAGFRCADDDE